MYVLLNARTIDMMYYFSNPDTLFEKSKNSRKVSKYKDKNGEIKEQLKYCIRWLDEEIIQYVQICKIISLKKIVKFFKAKGYSSKKYKTLKREYMSYSGNNSDFFEFVLLKFLKSDMQKSIKSNSYKIQKLTTAKIKINHDQLLQLPISNHKLKERFLQNLDETTEIPISIYKKDDVVRFLLLLDYAVKVDRIKDLLDIPDVFYILRQIICVGLDYYFK